MFYDSFSGSYRSRERTDISPTLGRPFQVDPLGYGPDVNRYRWEMNSPNSFVDPSGLIQVGTPYAGTIKYSDVNQELPQDCWLISVLVGMAFRRSSTLKDMIRQTPGKPAGSYTVYFPGKDPVCVTYDGKGSKPEWVRVIELAAAKYVDIDSPVVFGLSKAITLLTGHSTSSSYNSLGFGFSNRWIKAIDDRKIVIAATGISAFNKVKDPRIVQKHVYAILTRVVGAKVAKFVVRDPELDNPGLGGPATATATFGFNLSQAEVDDNFLAVAWED